MNATLKDLLLMVIICFAFSSCEKAEQEIISSKPKEVLSRIDTITETFPEYHEEDEIILGDQRNNPYEIHNMLQAYDLLQDYRQNFAVGDVTPTVNTIYYRVLPRDSAELAIISADTTIIYFDYPLDYDIVQWGTYYHDPSLGDTPYTWLYAVVPANHPLPHLNTLEILAECYIPNEPVGNDNQYDELPDWKNGFAMLEYMAYLISGNIDMYDPEVVAIYDDIFAETANRNLRDYQPSSDDRTRNSFWDFITGVHPEGNFKVKNSFTGNEEGIKNAKVFIHNIIKIYCGPLDSQGHYYSQKRFRTHCWYHIRFENYHTLTKIYGGSKFLLGPVHRHLGWHRRYGYSYTLCHDDEAWRYATINNATEKYYDYCQEYNILFPYHMRIWVAGLGNGEWSGSTPLFHKRDVPIQRMLFSIVGPLACLVSFLQVPDMGLFIYQGDDRYETLSVYETVFHELAHASHYEKVGANYWRNYVLHVIANTGYGERPEGLYHGYCGIGEMWGYFAGSHFLYKYMEYSYPYIKLTNTGYLDTGAYNPTINFGASNYPYGSQYLEFDPWADWFHPGILAKIHEDSQCSISDIYNALNPDVYSLSTLSTSLQHQGISETIINQAYNRYGEW